MKCGSAEELNVLRWIAREAKRLAQADRVLLFGSRARGDADERSDFDIAIDTGDTSKLALLQAALDENPVTLLAFDVVDLSNVDPEFRNRILSEAKDITNV